MDMRQGLVVKLQSTVRASASCEKDSSHPRRFSGASAHELPEQIFLMQNAGGQLLIIQH
jgi:hypothetical protein